MTVCEADTYEQAEALVRKYCYLGWDDETVAIVTDGKRSDGSDTMRRQGYTGYLLPFAELNELAPSCPPTTGWPSSSVVSPASNCEAGRRGSSPCRP
jgi:hypothetical protein